MFFLPMWESDLTARAAIEQSVAASMTDAGTGALMAGFAAGLDGMTRGPRSHYGFSLDGSYDRVYEFMLPSWDVIPSYSASAHLGATAGWTLSPRVDLSLTSWGYLATQLGIRATDVLAVRDPFLFGNRLQYTFGAGPSLYIGVSPRATMYVSTTYQQVGALTADDPAAVGVDERTGRADVSYAYDLSPVDLITPELRYDTTHFYHALLTTTLLRGPADVQTGSALLNETHAFSQNLTARIGGGVTVGSPPPILGTRDIVVRPAARAGLTYAAERYRLVASYVYEYASLGPRIGFGQQHELGVDMSFRPLRGAARRDVVITGIGRLSMGGAPVAENPTLLIDPAGPPPSTEGTLSTYTALGGAEIEVPLVRGLLARGSVDLEYVRASIDPAPPTGQLAASLRTIFTVGIVGTLSTDERRTVHRDPDDGWDDQRRGAMMQEMPSGRWQSPAPGQPGANAPDTAPGEPGGSDSAPTDGVQAAPDSAPPDAHDR